MKLSQKILATSFVLSAVQLSALADVPSTSAYKTDARFSYNKDSSADALQIIGIVACYVRNMAPEKAFAQIGSEPYVAMVDVNKCESDKKQADSGSGATVETKRYDSAVVKSTVNADGVLESKIWISGKEEDGRTVKTWVSAKIAGGPAKKPPFGEWEVNWCDDYDAATNTCAMKGHARVDAQGSRAYHHDKASNYESEGAVVGSVSADETTGGGRYFKIQKDGNGVLRRSPSGFYGFAPGLMYSNLTNNITNQTNELCLVPDSTAAGAKVSTWETWLYDKTTGERYDVNSGFSLRDSNNDWGWAGYWGVNVGKRNVTNGETLKRVNQSDQVIGTYTAVVAKGKLRKITVSTGNLNSLADLTLRGSAPKSVLGIGDSNTWVSITFKWDKTNEKFVISTWDNCSNGTCTTTSLQTPVQISLATLTGDPASVPGGLNQNNLWTWQEGTNSNYNIILAEWRETNGSWSRVRYTNPVDVIVKSRNEVVVTPGDSTASVPSNLYCVGNCVDSNITQVNNSSVKQADVKGPYVWSGSDGSLKYNNSNIDFTASTNKSSFWSGVLVAQQDLSSLACQTWDSATNRNVAAYCEWNADKNLTTYYRWESGPNSWNTFTGVRGSDGNLVKFDPPLNVTYDVPANDTSAGAYAGKTAAFQYPGGGRLWVPGYCFDTDTLARKQCDSNTEWANEFTIPFSETVGVVKAPSQNNKEYLVKTLRQGIFYPQSASLNDCNTLKTSAQTYSNKVLPTAADWKNPADPASTLYIGAWQDPTKPPLIIDGELQKAN